MIPGRCFCTNPTPTLHQPYTTSQCVKVRPPDNHTLPEQFQCDRREDAKGRRSRLASRSGHPRPLAPRGASELQSRHHEPRSDHPLRRLLRKPRLRRSREVLHAALDPARQRHFARLPDEGDVPLPERGRIHGPSARNGGSDTADAARLHERQRRPRDQRSLPEHAVAEVHHHQRIRISAEWRLGRSGPDLGAADHVERRRFRALLSSRIGSRVAA